VVTGLLASQPAGVLGVSWAFLAWALFMAGAFLAVGVVASRAVGGAAPSFYMELPPLRWPRPANVAAKTFARMRWYFLEVLPLGGIDRFELRSLHVEGELAYITWNVGSDIPLGTDTFVVDDGKIVAQTFAMYVAPTAYRG